MWLGLNNVGWVEGVEIMSLLSRHFQNNTIKMKLFFLQPPQISSFKKLLNQHHNTWKLI